MTFNATVESNAKMTFDNQTFRWEANDQVMFIDLGYHRSSVTPDAGSISADGRCASFTTSGLSGNKFFIYYPANRYTPTYSPNYSHTPKVPLGATQTYNANKIVNFPMYAETENETFQFNNLCGIIRFNLQKANTSIKKIEITTDNQVSGNYMRITKDANDKFQVATTPSTTNNTITLNCGNGVSIDNATDFNIFLPVGAYSTFTVTFTNTNNQTCTKSLQAGAVININRNEIIHANYSNLVFE